MRNYVVIGGSSGIGRAIVNLLEAEEASVFASYNTNKVEDSSATTYFPLDVTSDMLDPDLLPEEIHGLAYCPGSINLKPFHRFTEAQFMEDFQLQVLGATKIIQQLLPRLKKTEGASILLFSTIAVQAGYSFHSQVALSKGAIEGLTRSLAAEFAPKIRVNALAPSLTDTPLAERFLSTPEKVQFHAEKNPLKKIGAAEDLAKAALFLLTPSSNWVTGQIIHVDGGASVVRQ